MQCKCFDDNLIMSNYSVKKNAVVSKDHSLSSERTNKKFPLFLFAVADQLQNLWGQTPPSSGSSFTTPSPPDHVAVSGSGNSHNLHSLFTSSPLLAANAAAAAAAAAASLSLPPPPPPPQASGSRLHSPGSAEAELYGGQSGSYTPFTSFHQVCNQTADFFSIMKVIWHKFHCTT